jgi:diguanylate cyclase (GGDEF)-like protein
MPKNPDSVLESVVRITEERDKKSLERALIDTLADFITFDAVILLRLSRGTEELEVAVSGPARVGETKLDYITRESGVPGVRRDTGMGRCIDENTIVAEVLDSTTRTLIPVEAAGKVSGVLAVYGRKLSENNKRLIRGFLRIHSNFLAVLDDNEHDTLSGLLNRKTFDARLAELISGTQAGNGVTAKGKTERRLSHGETHHWLGVLDIDHFKAINDNFGHVYGDEVLLLFSHQMKMTFRNTDLLFRYGGEEFVVVLAPCSEQDAANVFERFRQRIANLDFPKVVRVTVSIGMVRIGAQENPTTVVQYADQALYYAKEHGRNQTCSYDHLIKSGLLKERHYEGDIELF